MRSFIPALLLAACASEQAMYAVTDIETISAPAIHTVTVTETITNTVTVTVPVEEEPEPECGFVHYWWFDQDGLYTETDLTASMLSPATIQKFPGDAVEYTVEIVNADCGWAVVDGFDFAISAWGNNPWIETLEAEDPPAIISFPLENDVYEIVGYNILAPGLGEQLFYSFHTEPIWIAPGDSTIVNFSFDATEGLLTGQSFEIHMFAVGWRDIVTGEHTLVDLNYPDFFMTATML